MRGALLIGIFLVVLLSSCAPQAEEFFKCEQRPEMCPMIYDPVCATIDTGIRCEKAPCPSVQWETKSNPCVACSDPNTYGYTWGDCNIPQAVEAMRESAAPEQRDYNTWPRCGRPNDCDFSCAYVMRDFNGKLIGWQEELDENGFPTDAARCISPEYAQFIIDYGFVTIDKHGSATLAMS